MVSFTEENFCIQDLKSKRILVTGEQNDGLYVFKNNPNCSKVCSSSQFESDLWHSRLGHPFDQVLSVLKEKLKLNLSKDSLPCDVCHKAKQTRNPFPLSEHKSKEVGELVHLDLWGPYKVPSREGYKYFLTIVDDYSRADWVFLLKSKDEVFSNIETYVNLLKTQFDKKVKSF
ncbi:putative RNA-directed DNA polymerase [Helianthus debilis subsp. tardiflorus]